MAKARNGMGSIRLRPDGRYEARYTGSDGKQHSLFGHTSSEVSKKLRAATAAVDTGDWIKPQTMTFADWAEVWLRDYCTELRPNTLKAYRITLDHVLPVIGKLKLSAIKPAHIQRVQAAMVAEGLKPSSVHNYMVNLTTCLTAAVHAEIIGKNPAQVVTKVKRSETEKIHIIDRDKFDAFRAACDDQRHGNALKLMLYTGMRAGELMGLTWDDVDLAAKTITIRHQVVSNSTQQAKALTATKNGKIRTIVVTDETVRLLRAIRQQNAENQLAAGQLWYDAEPDCRLVVRNKDGHEIGCHPLNTAAKNVGRAIGIDGLHTHDLRHSYAVAALRAGVDVKTVQHNLGHASATMTLDVYARYTDDAGAAAAEKLAAWLGSN